uniref:hypothetical protein n=1 Tax=Aneurinibacillus tyrosinisolvens TaxID=1443435 RepID=UPI00063FC24A
PMPQFQMPAQQQMPMYGQQLPAEEMKEKKESPGVCLPPQPLAPGVQYIPPGTSMPSQQPASPYSMYPTQHDFIGAPPGMLPQSGYPTTMGNIMNPYTHSPAMPYQAYAMPYEPSPLHAYPSYHHTKPGWKGYGGHESSSSCSSSS